MGNQQGMPGFFPGMMIPQGGFQNSSNAMTQNPGQARILPSNINLPTTNGYNACNCVGPGSNLATPAFGSSVPAFSGNNNSSVIPSAVASNATPTPAVNAATGQVTAAQAPDAAMTGILGSALSGVTGAAQPVTAATGPNLFSNAAQGLASAGAMANGAVNGLGAMANGAVNGLGAMANGIGSAASGAANGLGAMGSSILGGAQHLFGAPLVAHMQEPQAYHTPTTYADYIKWKNAATYEDYLSARKYYTWKDYALHHDLSVDDWRAYAKKWKPLWQEMLKANPNQFISSFNNWLNIVNRDDYHLWFEWMAWRALKKELHARNSKGNNPLVCYKNYKDWHKDSDLKMFGRYYRYLSWRHHARHHNHKHNSSSKYRDWARNWDYSPSYLRNYYNNWRHHYSDRDFHYYWDWNNWRHRDDDFIIIELEPSRNRNYQHGPNYGRNYHDGNSYDGHNYSNYDGRNYSNYDGRNYNRGRSYDDRDYSDNNHRYMKREKSEDSSSSSTSSISSGSLPRRRRSHRHHKDNRKNDSASLPWSK